MPLPFATLQLRVSGRHAPDSTWKPALQLVGAHVLHAVPPAAQLCEPVPFAIAQLCEPAGLVHACDVAGAAPHTAVFVGVHACDVTSVPQLAVVAGVQLCEAAGCALTQFELATVSPKLFTHVTARDCEPLFAFQSHDAVRDCEPLDAVKLHVLVRVCVPLPLHTALAEHEPHALDDQVPLPPLHVPHAP